MLKEVSDTEIILECSRCSIIVTKKISEQEPLQFLEEFGEYENFNFECENCGLFEVYNMNLPEDEDLSEMPEEEQNQRILVHKLIKTLRADFIS